MLHRELGFRDTSLTGLIPDGTDVGAFEYLETVVRRRGAKWRLRREQSPQRNGKKPTHEMMSSITRRRDR
jgi:hypothetical protein